MVENFHVNRGSKYETDKRKKNRRGDTHTTDQKKTYKKKEEKGKTNETNDHKSERRKQKKEKDE